MINTHDFFTDLLAHTTPIECFKLLRVDVDAKGHAISDTMDTDTRSVMLDAVATDTVNTITEKFGIQNGQLLNKMLANPAYAKDAGGAVQVTKRKDPAARLLPYLEFDGYANNTVGRLQLINENQIDSVLPHPNFKGATWDVVEEAPIAGIKELVAHAGMFPDPLCYFKINNGGLDITIDDRIIDAQSTFTFIDNVGLVNNITPQLSMPGCFIASVMIAILSTAGDKVIQISNKGVMQIIVDSGLVVYTYTLPAMIK